MRISCFTWLVSLAACVGASDSGPDQVPAGDWGGEHVALEVTGGGGRLDFDCAHATISEPLRLTGGRFSVAGIYVREHGGPEREGEPEDRHPARFEGTLRGDELTFSVHLTDSDESMGSFTVVRNRRPLVFKCG